jgi:ferrous iron transport protein B
MNEEPKSPENEKDSACEIVVVLAGNPNAGKTTLFNALTGLRQKVANYPGVTVERKEGVRKVGDRTFRLLDVPGLYSLDASSIDEQIARDVIAGRVEDFSRPDVIVSVIDATNIERNLYLFTQLLEFKTPIVVALTMMDTAVERGIVIDTAKLAEKLGVPVVPVKVGESAAIETLESAVILALNTEPKIPESLSDSSTQTGNAKIFTRYRFISDAVQESVSGLGDDSPRRSEKIDSVLTHPVFGYIALLAILILVFQTIFSWANLPMELLEQGFGAIGDFTRSAMPEGLLTDLLVDGVIAGVGGVLVFLPQILLLFLFISLLEDSGYMARAAFLLDRPMSRVGLHGKAFLPLMSSFACAIPGIMATRTIENPKDRLATILIAPFMSCSARLPVYALMIGTFFADQMVFGWISLGAVLIISMYLLGILTAVIVAFILKATLLSSPPPPFVMELPPYRLPNLRNVLMNVWSRAWLFVKRAGTVILALSIILWALMAFPRTDPARLVLTGDAEVDQKTIHSAQLANSYAGSIGHFIEPVIEPLGFNWKIGISLIASFAAREVLVSTLGIIYSGDKDANEESQSLKDALKEAKNDDGTTTWTPLTALTLMVFFVLAIQCISTVAVVRRETNSWAWTLFMVAYMTGIAYLGALITFQGGRLLGLG